MDTNEKKVRMKLVITADGSEEYSKNCVLKNKIYHIKGKQISEDGTIIPNSCKDYETGKNVLDLNLVYRGIVDYKNGSFIYGYFTPNKSKNVKIFVEIGNSFDMCISEDIIPIDLYFESYSDCCFLPIKEYTEKDILVKRSNRIIMSNYSHNQYNIEANTLLYNECLKYNSESNIIIGEKVKNLSRFIEGYKFGIEHEMASGYIPERLMYKHGWVMCRDGSTSSSIEAVSIPHKGESGLQHILNSFKYFKDNLRIDDSCSLHIHLSGLQHTRENIVALWKLCYNIQSEVFMMFNHSKQDYTLKNKNNEKNYNRALEEMMLKNKDKVFIDESYENIYYYLSQNENGSPMNIPNSKKIFSEIEHQSSHKWNQRNRYLWINFMNMFFSSRGTIEFRVHTPTNNPIKVISWLFICLAILKYVDKNKENILNKDENITLNEIVNIYSEENKGEGYALWLSNYLKSYIYKRKVDVMNDIKVDDYNGKREMKEDSDFSFSFLGETIV